MATLFETLQQRMAQPTTPTAEPEQAGVQKLLRAKAGKAGGAAGPAASNLAEQATLATGAQATQQQAVSGAMAGQALAQQAAAQQAGTTQAQRELAARGRMAGAELLTKGTQARENLAGNEERASAVREAQAAQKIAVLNSQALQDLRKRTTDRGISLDNIFSQFKQSNQELEFRKDAAELEQLGFQMAMSDKAYLDELDRIGKERQMESTVGFNEEMNRVVLGENLNATLDDLNFKTAFNAQQRDWEKTLTNMGIDAKLELARAMIDDSNKQAMWNGVGNLAGEGAKAAANYESKSPNTETAPSNGGGGGRSQVSQ